MWARLDSGKVVELTDIDPVGRFHHALVWVACDVGVRQGDVLSGGVNYDAQILLDARLKKQNEIDAAYSAALAVITDKYPESERNSWAKQESEARAWTTSNTASTPILNAISTARGITLAQQAAKVIANADVYAQIAGAIIGKRQARIAALNLTVTMADIEAVVW